MKTVYIIHGYQASINDHWFQWIKDNIESLDVIVKILALPNSLTPDLNEWLNYINSQVTEKENLYFIAHSLGCITILKYMANIYMGKVSGVVLVSPFDSKLDNIPQIDKFTEEIVDYDKLNNKCCIFHVFYSDNDIVVPSNYSIEISKKLPSMLHIIKNGGHFVAKDGYKTFEILKNTCIEMIKS